MSITCPTTTKALEIVYEFVWTLLGLTFLFLFVLPATRYFEFGLFNFHRHSFLTESLSLNTIQYPLYSFLYILLVEVFSIIICGHACIRYFSGQWVQFTLLTLVRIVCYLPQQYFSMLFLVSWGVFLSREIIKRKQITPLLIASTLATFTLFPITNERNILESATSDQWLYFFSVLTVLWAIFSFFPQKRLPSTSSLTDLTGTIAKKLHVIALPTVAIALANVCFQIVNTLWMFFSGSFKTPIDFLFSVFTLYPSTRFGIINGVCCIIAALWCHSRYSQTLPAKPTLQPIRGLNYLRHFLIGFASYVFIIDTSYTLMLSKGTFLTTLFPEEYWVPKHTETAHTIAEMESFSTSTLFAAFGGIEELIYTGVLSTLLFKKTRLHPYLSIFLLVFARIAIHLYQGVVPIFAVAIWSLFAAVYYFRTQRLTPLVLAHAFSNYYNHSNAGGDFYTNHLLQSYIFPSLILLGSLALVLYAKPRKLKA